VTSFSRLREKVPEGRMTADAQSAAEGSPQTTLKRPQRLTARPSSGASRATFSHADAREKERLLRLAELVVFGEAVGP
jgi:hypothetical protein